MSEVGRARSLFLKTKHLSVRDVNIPNTMEQMIHRIATRALCLQRPRIYSRVERERERNAEDL